MDKALESMGRLEQLSSKNSLCSYQINLTSTEKKGSEVIGWLEITYNQAG